MICDLSQYGCVKISGVDAQTFLQGQLTCDMQEVTDEKASYAAYCNQKGRTISVLRIIKHNNDYFLFTTGPFIETLFKNLKKFGQFSKIECTIESPNLKHFGFCGDDAKNNLTELNVKIPTETNQVIHTDEHLIFKNIGINNYELISWIPAYAGMTIQPDDKAWQLSLIESMVPAITETTCEKFTPHMLSLKNLNALSFSKGCYIGQEVVARTEHLGKAKRKLHNGVSDDITKKEIGTVINHCKINDQETKWLAVVSSL